MIKTQELNEILENEVPAIVLNDGETWTNLDGCRIIIPRPKRCTNGPLYVSLIFRYVKDPDGRPGFSLADEKVC